MEIDPAIDGEHHQAQDVGVTIPRSRAAKFSSTMRSPVVARMHTPVSFVSIYCDVTNATEMLHEENQEEYNGEHMDYGGKYEDYGDGFVNGEEDRKFKSKVWNDFIKIRVAGIMVNGQRKHCQAIITERRGVGTSAMLTHLRRCKVRRTMVNVVSQLNATTMSPQGVTMKDWRFNQEASRRELLQMIVLHELPLSIVEYEGFRRFVSSLNPVF